MHCSSFNLFPHKVSQIFQKVLCSLFQKYKWWHVQLYSAHSLYLFHKLDELCHTDTVNQAQHSMKHRQQLVDVICIPGTGVLLLLNMISWSLSNRAKLVLWERKKIPVCLAEAQSWQCVAESQEMLSILCGSALWQSWFDFNIVFCLDCSSVKYAERLIEAMKTFPTLEIPATSNSIYHHCAKQPVKECAAWITTVHNQQIHLPPPPPAGWHMNLSKQSAQPWQGRVVYSSRNLWGYLGFLGLKSLRWGRWHEIRTSFQYSRSTLCNSTRREMLFVFQMAETSLATSSIPKSQVKTLSSNFCIYYSEFWSLHSCGYSRHWRVAPQEKELAL